MNEQHPPGLDEQISVLEAVVAQTGRTLMLRSFADGKPISDDAKRSILCLRAAVATLKDLRNAGASHERRPTPQGSHDASRVLAARGILAGGRFGYGGALMNDDHKDRPVGYGMAAIFAAIILGLITEVIPW